MKFEHYLKRVEESKEFKSFKGKNPKAYLCAGFFVLDFETDKHMHQIDYFMPDNKIATFVLDDGAKVKISEQPLKKKLPVIKNDAQTDLDSLKGIVEDEMKNRTVTGRIRKMVVILHMLDDKLVWNLQCILEGLGFLSVHVDDSDQSVLKFEKFSLLDLIKTPGQMMMKPKEAAEQVGEEVEDETEEPDKSSDKSRAIKEERAKQLIEQIKQQLAQANKQAAKKEKGAKPEQKKSKKKK